MGRFSILIAEEFCEAVGAGITGVVLPSNLDSQGLVF